MTTKIIKCNCKHNWQDEAYGYGNRVANETRNGQFRCTVCGSVSGSQSVTQIVAKKEVATGINKASENVVATKKPEKVTTKKKVAGDKKGKKDEKPLKKPSMKGGKR